MSRSSSRGYTVVELLMALTIFAIGVSGIISMQKIVAVSNQHSKRLAIATHIAEAWQQQLAADASVWNHPSPNNSAPDIGETDWVVEANNSPGAWVMPAWVPEKRFGPAFDALGEVVDPSTNLEQTQFCTHVRLSWLYPDTAGNGLIRTEVRVFWLREDVGGTVNALQLCDPNTDPALVEGAGTKYHFVYETSAVKQNTAN
jgi:prepilin-type N-terminal cleavage/methylation domain-containing protein